MINNYIAFALLTASFLYGQDSSQSVDGVAAVVGENIILKSDVSQVVGEDFMISMRQYGVGMVDCW